MINGGGATLSTATINATISGGSFVGGAVGDIEGGSALIETIVMNGTVTGSGNHVAGIFGKMTGGGATAQVLRADGAISALGTNVARIGGLLEGAKAKFLDAKSSAKLNGASPSGLKENLLGTHTGVGKVYEP